MIQPKGSLCWKTGASLGPSEGLLCCCLPWISALCWAGIISNLNASVLVAITWMGIVRQYGVSPLEGRWPEFLAGGGHRADAAVAQRAMVAARSSHTGEGGPTPLRHRAAARPFGVVPPQREASRECCGA
jgi:hypothetical protein